MEVTLRSKNTVQRAVDEFFYSNWYLAILLAISFVGFFWRCERAAMFINVILICVSMIYVKDITPTLPAFYLTAMTPLAMYGFKMESFYPLIALVIMALPAFIYHVIAYPVKYRGGKFLLPTVAVAFAVTFGGIFSPELAKFLSRPLKQMAPTLYYIVMCGVGMVVLYVIVDAYIPHKDKRSLDLFARSMALVGLMAIAMLGSQYIAQIEYFKENGFSVLYFQWKNNLSNNLLLSMPFCFYLAVKKKHGWPYYLIGIADFLVLMISKSRGGTIFALLIFPCLIVATLVFAKKSSRRIYLAVDALLLVVGAVAIYLFRDTIIGILERAFHASSEEARANLYKLAWQNFTAYPLFGVGMGYDGGKFYDPQDYAMYWYHSTFFQIIGSMGLCGLICYGYQFFVRLSVMFKNSKFNFFVLMSFAGFEGYSLVNTGDFAPIPFVLFLIEILIFCDRHNELAREDDELFEEDRILNNYGREFFSFGKAERTKTK